MGPYTPQAAGGAPDLSIEQAMGDAVAPSQAILGLETPQVSTRQAPGVQRMRPPQLMAPEFAWQPSQADLGQADVAQIQVDNHVVPVAQMRLPYGAIASRNSALANRNEAIAGRKQGLAAAKQRAAAQFDPMKGIDDPYAAYLPEWGRFMNSDLQRMVKERADAFHGGDMGDAWTYYSTDPEGQMEMRMWGNRAGSVARHSAAMGKRAEGALAKMQEGKLQAYMPEVYNNIAGTLNAMDPTTGIPFRAESLEDFNIRLRDAELAISQAEFTDTYLKEIDALAMQGERLMGEDGESLVKRLPGNHYLIPKEEITSFENIRDTYAESMADMGMFDGYKDRDKAVVKAKNFLDRILKDRVKYDEKVYAHTFGPKGGSSDSGSGGSGFTTSSVVRKPDAEGKISSESVLIHPWQVTNGKPHKVSKAPFNSTRGPITLYAPALTWDDKGHFFIEGKSLSNTDILKVKQEGYGDDGAESDFVVSRDIGKPFRVAAANNRGEMKALWDTDDEYEVIARQLRERGVDLTADRVRKEWSKPEQREKIKRKLSENIRIMEAGNAARVDVVSLAKANNVAFDQNVFDSWPKEKQDAFIAKLQTGAQTTATTAKSPKDKSTSSATIAKPVVTKEPTATKQASHGPPSQGAKEDEAPVVHPPKAVRDTLSATSKKRGYEAMRDRVDANYEPGTYQYKNQQQADDSMQARRVAKDTDPKGFFTEGVVVESKIGDKKVFYIMDKTGMRPLSDYFEDKESAGLVLDAFNKGEIHEEFLSKRSRSTKQAFEKLLNAK